MMKMGTRGPSRRILSGLCIILAGSISISAAATEIYTWTDENGVVHFSGTEPMSRETETIEIENSRGGVSYSQPVAAADMTEESATETPELTAAQQKRQDIAQARMTQKEQQAAIADLCDMHRKQLEEMEPARRVYYTNTEGQRVRMDDDERVALINESNKYVAENCH